MLGWIPVPSTSSFMPARKYFDSERVIYFMQARQSTIYFFSERDQLHASATIYFIQRERPRIYFMPEFISERERDVLDASATIFISESDLLHQRNRREMCLILR